MADLLAIGLDSAGRAHLARALDEHRRWCRANGRTMPATLVQLAALLTTTAPNGQARTTQRDEDDLPDTEPMTLAYTFSEAGDLLGISERTVRRLVAAGELQSITVGSLPRIHREDLSDYAQRLRKRAETQVPA